MIQVYQPHLLLKDYVASILTIDVELPPHLSEVVTPYPPSPFQSMIFYCNDSVRAAKAGDIGSQLQSYDVFEQQAITVITGPQYSRMNIMVQNRIRSVRVDFLPGAVYRLSGMPMHLLFDNGVDACEIFGARIGNLNERLSNTCSMHDCAELVQAFLLDHINSSGTQTLLPFDSAMLLFMKQDGLMSIGALASLSCLSLKQFERKCQERIGMNPKTYSRILRFSKAYRLHEKNPAMSWTSIAHESGYFDQMHMINDFRIFAGVNPSVIQSELTATPLRMQKDMSV